MEINSKKLLSLKRAEAFTWKYAFCRKDGQNFCLYFHFRDSEKMLKGLLIMCVVADNVRKLLKYH